ncbi:Molybdate-binding protein ModA [bioreactor metagenome]|uniref:Molybdate-binding protein ModA n=1 Tax=bioreactor metagenome TaxID=1076179 RepID=A0A644X1P4_9ZZZZ
MKKLLTLSLALILLFTVTACSSTQSAQTASPSPSASPTATPAEKEPVTLTIAAAASLEKTFTDKLIPAFEAKYDYITVEGTYDSSGKLQTQIEAGLAADVFMSAATKQMTALTDEKLVDTDSVVQLLQNKIVLIEPASKSSGITSFQDVPNAKDIAIGDPDSVPAGQYAKEVFTYLGIWDKVSAKASLGTNVTQVLNQVGEGSADVGVVYATDAASTDTVKVIAEAPEGSLAKPVIYPVGIIAVSQNKDAAQLFVDFLKSDEAMAIFEAAGFTSNLK